MSTPCGRAPSSLASLAAQLRRVPLLLMVLLHAAVSFAQQPEARAQLESAQLAALPTVLMGLGSVDLAQQPFVSPLPGRERISSGFGWRNIAVNGNRFHGGIDFPAPPGTAVLAARDGVVIRAGWWGTYGYAVTLDHGDGSETRYAHLSSIGVSVADTVRQGDVLGGVGSTGASTGPHLHFELRFDARAVDPTPYLRSSGVQVSR